MCPSALLCVCVCDMRMVWEYFVCLWCDVYVCVVWNMSTAWGCVVCGVYVCVMCGL